jgi:glucokinase
MKAYAGIDLGGTDIKYGLADKNGKIIIIRKAPARVSEGRDRLLENLKACAEELLKYARDNNLRVSYLGVGSPGTVDSDQGRLLGHSPNIPDWKGTGLAGYLTKHLRLPVYVGNDANLMALAEVLFGGARGYKNVFCTTIGTGIGGAVIIDGNLVTGKTYSAGEFGHIPIIKDGRRCKCGRRGCLEPYASVSGLLRYTRILVGRTRQKSAFVKFIRKKKSLTVKDIFYYFKANDSIAVKAVETQAEYMATGLATVVNLLNPEVVVIGGGIADAGGSSYIALIRKMLKERVLPDAAGDLKVVRARLGNKAGFIGAAFQREKLPV